MKEKQQAEPWAVKPPCEEQQVTFAEPEAQVIGAEQQSIRNDSSVDHLPAQPDPKLKSRRASSILQNGLFDIKPSKPFGILPNVDSDDEEEDATPRTQDLSAMLDRLPCMLAKPKPRAPVSKSSTCCRPTVASMMAGDTTPEQLRERALEVIREQCIYKDTPGGQKRDHPEAFDMAKYNFCWQIPLMRELLMPGVEFPIEPAPDFLPLPREPSFEERQAKAAKFRLNMEQRDLLQSCMVHRSDPLEPSSSRSLSRTSSSSSITITPSSSITITPSRPISPTSVSPRSFSPTLVSTRSFSPRPSSSTTIPPATPTFLTKALWCPRVPRPLPAELEILRVEHNRIVVEMRGGWIELIPAGCVVPRRSYSWWSTGVEGAEDLRDELVGATMLNEFTRAEYHWVLAYETLGRSWL